MGRVDYRPNSGRQTKCTLWAGVGSTSTNWLQSTVPSIPNARAVGPPTGRSLFLGRKPLGKPRLRGNCPLAQLERTYYDPRTPKLALAAH